MENLIILGLGGLSCVGSIGALFFVVIKIGRARQQAEANRFAQLAAHLRFQYFPTDQLGCMGLPFALLRNGGGVENVVVGRAPDGVEVRVFEYGYSTGSGDNRHHHAFTCVAQYLGTNFPPIAIQREGWFAGLRDALGMRDTQIGNPAFDAVFNVKSSDPRFALTLLDEQMIELLFTAPTDLKFELAGGWLLAAVSRVVPERAPHLISFADEVRRRTPQGAWQWYGGRIEG